MQHTTSNHWFSNSFINCVAHELQKLAKSQRILSCQLIDNERWLLQWPACSLLIELHPNHAGCLLLTRTIHKNECKRPFSIPGPKLDSSTQNFWLEKLSNCELIHVWASSGCLHLNLKSIQNEKNIHLIARFHARRPNLYLYEDGQPLPLFPTNFIPNPNCESLNETNSSIDSSQLLEIWNQHEQIWAKKHQEQQIRDYYDNLILHAARRIQKLQHSLDKLENPEVLIHEGQLLQANRHLLQKGVSTVKVWDWVNSTECEVSVDPSDHPKQIEERFQRAKGLQAHRNQLIQQLEVWKKKLAEYQTQLEQDLLSGKLNQPLSQAKKKNSKEPSKPYYGFTYQGARIYVGKNSADNLKVSFQVAHGNDLWLHVSDYPGSHVVVKANEVTPQILKASALLAHHYSQARKLACVCVTYTQAKWVKRLPGVKTGTVGVSHSQTYLSSYDEILLQELLASKNSFI